MSDPTAPIDRLAFLAEASAVLAGSLDYETTLQSVARLVVSALADYCVIDVIEEDDSFRRLAMAHRDPARDELVQRLRYYPPAPEGPHPLIGVLREGRSAVVPDIAPALAEIARDAEHLALLRALAPTSYLAVPMVARGRVLGAITCVATHGSRRYGEADLPLAEDLARRAAVAVDNARLYRAAQHEIAERRRAEEALRASRDQLAIILRGVADGITAQDAAGRLVFANEAAARAVGAASVEALLTTPVQELMAGFELLDEAGDPFPLEKLPGRLALQGVENAEAVLRFRVVATGEERWANVKATPVFVEQGRPRLAINIFHDVSERKRVEEALRFLDRATAALAESLDYETTLATLARLPVPDLADWCAVNAVDESGGARPVAVAHVDPAREAWGRELLPRYPLDLAAAQGAGKVLRTGRSELYPEMPDAFLEAAAQDAEHLEIMRSLGMRSAMIVPLQARGRTLGSITLVSAGRAPGDQTSEAARRPAGRRYGPADLVIAEELARRAALALDNARLYSQVQEAVRVRDEFLAAASHDLRTPLTTIRTLAQLAQRRAARDSAPDERLDETLEGIVGATSRMTALIGDLLDVARLQSGRPLQLDRCPTDLVELARRVAADQQRAARQQRIRVGPAVPELVGSWDPVRLERIVANLVSNAVKYSPNGGDVVLRVEHEADAEGRWAVLHVIDQGIGIPAADLSRIFEGFQRAGNVGRISGTGVGLASVRQIVEQHGGTISATSQEGAGSTFTVRLPLAQ